MLHGTRTILPRCLIIPLMFFSAAAHALDWLPVDPEELKMTVVPAAPRAEAVYLYRQVDRDDGGPSELVYERIKILTNEGKSFGNVHIVYDRENERITSIDARTIRPDGSIVKFEGEIFDEAMAKSRKVKMYAKTFTMPDVQVGSIIEYHYRRQMSVGWVFNSHWILSADLYTKLARFSLIPADGFWLQWSWPTGLPPGTTPPAKDHGRVRLETRDVPAFIDEEFAPPDDLLKYRVDFMYGDPDEMEKDSAVYWRKQGRKLFNKVDKFIDEKSAMREALAQIIKPEDAPDLRLRKIYERVQQIRNLSFERDRTEEEDKRENIKTNDDVEDVWKRGYGEAWQINWLFLALAREAGLKAEPVQISTRDSFFFQPALQNKWQLVTNVVLVKVDGMDTFVDPGVQFAPLGVLPWNETFVSGLLLDKTGGGWVVTPIPTPIQSRIERKAVLDLAQDGSVSGKLTVTYTGLQALTRRLAERHADKTERKRYLEADVKTAIPVGIDVELVNEPDWSSSSSMLVAQFKLKINGWATSAGRRLLLPASLFTGHESEAFGHAARTHPLYFEYPYQYNDYVNIKLPQGLSVGALPKPQNKEQDKLAYQFGAEVEGDALSLHRQLSVNAVMIPASQYEGFRSFFQGVKAADEEQIIIAAAPTAPPSTRSR
jgi:hypothetical protein